jgi:hypothetical protein
MADTDSLPAAAEPADPGFCQAVSQHGTFVTAYLGEMPVVAVAKPGRDFVCTQDSPDHAGNHSACDGEGHILARWPRKDPEHYWHPGDCKGHGHG